MKMVNLRQVKRSMSSQKNKQPLNKKLELGKEYVLLFPKKDNELVAAAIVGRACSYDDLGMSFGRLSDKQMEVNEETGRIKDKSGMQAWANLSSILYKAAQLKEIEEAKEEAQKVADKTGSPVDRTSLSQTIDKINAKYEGIPKQGDTPAQAPTANRLVSSRISYDVATEAVLVPLDKELHPEYDKAVAVEVKLRETKITQLLDNLDNPNYNDKDDPDGFLEVRFSYKGKDKKEAGKNNFVGQEKSVRKINQEKDSNGKYVDPNVESIKGVLSSVTNDYDVMFSRSGAVSFAKTAADVETAMRKFLSTNRLLPLYIDMEDEMTRKNAKLILDLGCVYNVGSPQYETLKAMIEEDSEEVESTEHEVTADVEKLYEAKTVREFDDLAKGNEELAAMMNGDDDEIKDI